MNARRPSLLIAALALAGTLLAACGGDGDGDGDASSSTPPPSPTSSGTGGSGGTGDEEACATRLAQSAALAGVGEIGEVSLTEVGGVQACRASVSGSEVGVEDVQLIETSAAQWAEGLPEALAQVLNAGVITDQGNLAKIREAQELLGSGEGLDDAGACDLFATLVVELQGAAPGARSVVNSVPSEQAPVAVNGQACSGDAYTSIQVENPAGVQGGAVLQELVRGALDDFHEGPLG